MSLTFAVPDTELSLTLHNRRAQIVDNIFTGTAFLNMLRLQGGVDTTGGGLQLVRGVRMAANANVTAFAGVTPTFTTTLEDTATSAVYDWVSYCAMVNLYWDQTLKNMGPGRLINMVNQKIDDAEMTLRDTINGNLLEASTTISNSPKEVNTIHEIVDDVPTGALTRGTGPTGGIDQTAQAWWRNVTSGTPAAFSLAKLHETYNNITDGQEPPSFGISNQSFYETYEATLQDQVRYLDMRMADASFQALAYKSIPITWDPAYDLASMQGTTVDAVTFLNTNYTKLTFHEEAQFVTTDFIEPTNAASKSAKILAMMQLNCTNRRRNGVYSST